MAGNTIYVVTGANRGLGRGLMEALLKRPKTTVIVTVRNAEAAALLASEDLEIATNSIRLTAVLDFTSAPSKEDVHTALNKAAGGSIDHIDVLINNAGMCPTLAPAAQTLAPDLRAAYETNVIAPLMVFQALWSLLQRATSVPKLVMMTSSLGSIGAQEPFPGGAYGPSKAALNWITRALHLQHEAQGLVAIALHPGWVQTRAGNFVAEEWGYTSGPPDTVEKSVGDILVIVDGATRESVGGKYITQAGAELPW
jgi:NAD(P)-dependent dehydrogenase (short-subunit alcohol dehydrogenase family)